MGPRDERRAPDLGPSSAAAKAVAERLRIEAIEEAADICIPFLVGLREAARDGDIDRVGDCLRAVWLAAVTMRKAFKGIGACGDDPAAGP